MDAKMQHSRAFTRALTRLLLALLSITCFVMVFIGRCGLNLDSGTGEGGAGIPEDFTRGGGGGGGSDRDSSGARKAPPGNDAEAPFGAPRNFQRRSSKRVEGEALQQEAQQLQQQTEHLRHLLAQREEQHKNDIAKLRQQIEALRSQISESSQRGNGARASARASELQRGRVGDALDLRSGGEAGADSPQFHDFVRRSGIEGPPPPQLSVVEEQRLVNSKLDLNKFIDARIEDSEILHGQAMRTEYEVIPYNRFTLTRLFMVDPGLGRRVVEKPIGLRKKEILEVVAKAVEVLNHRHVDASREVNFEEILERTFVAEDFVEGIYRTEPTVGTHYELYFKIPKASIREQTRSKEEGPGTKAWSQSSAETTARGNAGLAGGDLGGGVDTGRLKKVTLLRPFAPPQLVRPPDDRRRPVAQEEKPLINLILPLSGRVEKFRSFMEKFVRVCVKQDRRVFLTVVYFGEAGLKEVSNILGGVSKLYSFKSLKLVTVNDSAFSRGKGLQVGVEAWASGAQGKKDVLMFLCDVDVIFNVEFLERCRHNTSPGKKVYYPILFSLYNPNIVYSLHDAPIPAELDQLVISKDTGWWRDFGFGMTCQYRSDFLAVKGFDEEIQGWGGEDVGLYRKYVKSGRRVIRAVDPGIFHMWHEKYCDPNLSADQYRNCIRSKALNEASHAQLGLLAFKDEIDIHRSYLKKDDIKNIPQSKINR